MSKHLDEIAKRVADEQAALDGNTETTRQRVIRMGKELREAQIEQKKEQEETGQTWKQWCEEQKTARPSFPVANDCTKYTLIARYPGAYKAGDSIKEAYKQAGLWKKNGGKAPDKVKVTISSRPLVTIGAMCGKLERKIEAATEIDIDSLKGKERWDDDEISGAVDALNMVRQAANGLLRKLKELSANEVH
jgi:hypothetical protein